MNPALLRRPLAAVAVLILVIFVFLLRSDTHPFLKKKTGSFEYYRTGEQLLDKGRYREAVSCFEKAYESSPENKEIVAALCYAYSRYAQSFWEMDDYDHAIEYLEKAFDLKQGANTAQNLALIYSKRALARARNGDPAGSVPDFTKAREIVSDSGRASRFLGESLFSDGAKEFKDGREKTAVLCLKESMLAYEDLRPMVLLGGIYYKAGELDKAFFYWDKARRLEPGNSELRSKLKRLAKEVRLRGLQRAKALPHFEIKYEKAVSANASDVERFLERAYFDVGGDLDFYPAAKTAAIFYSQDSFKDIFKLPDTVRAFYDGSIRIPLPKTTLTKDELKRYIYHEYSHAAVSAKTRNNCPVWFSEGIAVLEEFRGERIPLASIGDMLKDGSSLSLAILDKAFSGALKGQDMRRNYILAYSVVRYIVDGWGMAGLRNILSRIADGRHVINAIDDELLLSEREFEKKWEKYVYKELQ